MTATVTHINARGGIDGIAAELEDDLHRALDRLSHYLYILQPGPMRDAVEQLHQGAEGGADYVSAWRDALDDTETEQVEYDDDSDRVDL